MKLVRSNDSVVQDNDCAHGKFIARDLHGIGDFPRRNSIGSKQGRIA